MVVPTSAGTVNRWLTAPPSPARRSPWLSPRARLVTVKRETAQIQRDRARPGVERVLHELLDHRGGTLDDLAGGDLVDQGVGQSPDRHYGRRCCCHFASRFNASIGVRWLRSRCASSSPIGSAGAANSPSCTASVASVVACPCSSKRASRALARAMTPMGSPASRAT